MTYKQNGVSIVALTFFHFFYAFLLKLGITHGQHFIHNQYFRLQMGRHGKGKPHIHAGRIALHRGIKKFFHPGKIYDFIKLAAHFSPTHTENSTIEKNIFPAGKLGMKARTNFQQTGDTSP